MQIEHHHPAEVKKRLHPRTYRTFAELKYESSGRASYSGSAHAQESATLVRYWGPLDTVSDEVSPSQSSVFLALLGAGLDSVERPKPVSAKPVSPLATAVVRYLHAILLKDSAAREVDALLSEIYSLVGEGKERYAGHRFSDSFMAWVDSGRTAEIDRFLRDAKPEELGLYMCLLVSTFSRMPVNRSPERAGFLQRARPVVEQLAGQRWSKFARSFE